MQLLEQRTFACLLAGNIPGPLLGDLGLHQGSWRPGQQHPLLASLGAPCQDELCHLPAPHERHEYREQLCQPQGQCQPGTDIRILKFSFLALLGAHHLLHHICHGPEHCSLLCPHCAI